jgi:anti-anti-sigma regulatory factor
MAKSSKLVLCGLSPFVAKMIDLGGISRVIRIKQDVREAIEAVSSDT